MPKNLKRREDIHFAEVEDEFFVTLEDGDVVVCINQSGFAVLENLDGFTSEEHISHGLAKNIKRNDKELRSSVAEFCAKIRDLGLVEEVEVKSDGPKPLNFMSPRLADEVPKVVQAWQGKELEGGLFVNSGACDIHVIVPNVTQGPIKTCPPHTCTIPAGLFTANTIIRTFSPQWRSNFSNFRRSGLVHFKKDIREE